MPELDVLQEMNKTVATCMLWCRDGESIIEFEVSLGTPYKVEFKWFCEWSLGRLAKEHPAGAVFCELGPGMGYSSMHALASAQGRILRSLEFIENTGASFYTDSRESDLIEDLRAFFPSLQRRRPEKKASFRVKE